MGNMSNGEMWAVVFISFYWFTGLWRITKQLPIVIRSGLLPEKDSDMKFLLFTAQCGRFSGLLTAVLITASIYDGTPIPNCFWIFIVFGSFCTIYVAGQGRKIIGGRIPTWMISQSTQYEGFGESQERLPETSNEIAKSLFQDGLEAEVAEDFGKAIGIYEEVLIIDPTHVKCLIAKGIIHCMRKELQEGEELFLQASRVCPTSAFALYLLSRVEKQLGIYSWKDHELTAQHNLDVERTKEMLDKYR